MAKKQPHFTASQFTATQFDSAENKAKWANAMATWIEAGFPAQRWTHNLYHHLYQHMYGHIAHYDSAGFFAVWFSDRGRQLQWLQHATQGAIYGDPAYTWSDVEHVLRDWIIQTKQVARFTKIVNEQVEEEERAQLAYLKAKYGE